MIRMTLFRSAPLRLLLDWRSGMALRYLRAQCRLTRLVLTASCALALSEYMNPCIIVWTSEMNLKGSMPPITFKAPVQNFFRRPC